MQPQDIRLGLSHYQNIANAMDKSVEAQNMITQSFDKLADNAMKFSDFFARRQEAQEQKAFREKAYNDEKAYREERDRINDERYTQEFDENKRRYDSDLAIRNKVANAQVANYNANTKATNQQTAYNQGVYSTALLNQYEDVSSNDNKIVAKAISKQGVGDALIQIAGDKALKKQQKEFDKNKVNKTAGLDTPTTPNLTNSNLPIAEKNDNKWHN